MAYNQGLAARFNRRTFLKTFTLGGLWLLSGGASSLLQGCSLPAQVGQDASLPVDGSLTTFFPDVEIMLTATKTSTQMLPGVATTTWSYRGEVIQGDSTAVQALSGSYLGPILRLHKGQKVRITLKNELDEETIIHWHGLIVPSEMDGLPQYAIAPGETYVYEFEVQNRAGTYWFHPHPHGRTAQQVYLGMAGLLLISDEDEAALMLPADTYDVPIVLQDRTFDANNQLVYGEEAIQQSMGFLGDRILVNGLPDFVLPVTTHPYRLRLLNGSNARIYKLAWSNGMPMTVIATDGGLLEQPIQRTAVTLSPGERIELWADFTQEAVGTQITLQSLAFSGVEAGMFMGGMRMAMEETATLANGTPFAVLTVNVMRTETDTTPFPTHLANLERLQSTDAMNAAHPRQFSLSMAGGQWLINGKSFVMDEVTADEQVTLGTTEVWELINEFNPASMVLGAQSHLGHVQGGHTSGASMAGEMIDFMAHPIHLHGVQFQVLARTVDPAYEQAWQTVSDGFVDEGWKDTVLVMPGERVKLLVRFVDYPGLYLIHCHNLEHEDRGMMRHYLIRSIDDLPR